MLQLKATSFAPHSSLYQLELQYPPIFLDSCEIPTWKVFTNFQIFFSKHQHGFVKGKSCLSNLLETFDDSKIQFFK